MGNPTICTRCQKDVERFKYLKKVNGDFLCKECYKENKKNHREKTIEEVGIKDELRELKNKQDREYREENKEHISQKNREWYEKKVGHKVIPREKKEEYVPRRYRKQFNKEDIPIIKGSKKDKKEIRKLNSLSLYERQVLYRIFKSQGLEHKEAIERVNQVAKQQLIIKEKLKEEGKSEEEIKVKQKQMIQELMNYG